MPAPQIENHDEFPSLSEALPGKRSATPAPDSSKMPEREVLAEEAVCVDGTTYYIQAGAALCGIPDAISPIALGSSYTTQKETSGHRQFPGRAYSLYEGNLEYPTVFLPKNLRQAVYERLDEYRSYLFLPDQQTWTLCDNFQIYGSMEKQSGLVHGKKNLVYISRHRENGDFYIIRRLIDFVLRNQRAVNIASKWQTIDHPNVVRLHSVTTTRAFTDQSVLFAYDFYPNAMTLEAFVQNESSLLTRAYLRESWKRSAS
ncbi:PAN2-PAN3 deadenylation complex subunit PAN3 [Galendromus occidentalis]|uniref:PAN2-PAN3 deadenylation complex subunit PAN3 n=1 Tax=Galendromus occidentalis TaxID=34638 RepID=A0AAJ7PAP4_9ACAR|nr:PAN2-PAN3 deadenylation complex subunit PAN3 [Galendromus occidentalis]